MLISSHPVRYNNFNKNLLVWETYNCILFQRKDLLSVVFFLSPCSCFSLSFTGHIVGSDDRTRLYALQKRKFSLVFNVRTRISVSLLFMIIFVAIISIVVVIIIKCYCYCYYNLILLRLLLFFLNWVARQIHTYYFL